MTWTDVPPPPAPTGTNLWPPPPPPFTCWNGPLPDTGGLIDLNLNVTGVYQSLLQATVSPNSSLTKTITYEQGASFTSGTETEFGMSLGIQAPDFANIGTSLTHTTSHSTTLYASTTTSYEFTLSSSSGSVSVCVWQLVYTYTITGTVALGIFPFTAVMVDALDTFSSTQFPAAADVSNLAGGTEPGLDRLFARPARARAAV